MRRRGLVSKRSLRGKRRHEQEHRKPSLRTSEAPPSALAGAVAIALYGGAAPVRAQEAALEEVVVTGIRASLRDSHRDASATPTTVVEVDHGRGRRQVPGQERRGIAAARAGRRHQPEFGEGERVSLRGTAPNLTRTLLNGHGLATADWFILDQLNTTRSFNYLMLPVRHHRQRRGATRAPQADFEEGGIGGTINVITRNPLDLESMAFYGLGAGGLHRPRRRVRRRRRTCCSAGRTTRRTSASCSPAPTRSARSAATASKCSATSRSTPTGRARRTCSPRRCIGSALFQQDRERTGGNIGIQFRPNDRLEFNLTGLYSEFDADNINAELPGLGCRARSATAAR